MYWVGLPRNYEAFYQKKKIKIRTMKLAIFSGLREKVAHMTAADQFSVSSTYYTALSPYRSGVGNHN